MWEPPITATIFNMYSVDDALVTEERTPCKILSDIIGLGHMNPSTEDQDLKAGTAIELPIWLVLDLMKVRPAIIQPEVPKIYGEKYREIIMADPRAVELPKLNYYFYQLGLYAQQFERGDEIRKLLVYTFTSRFRMIMDLAESEDPDPKIFCKLDNLERRIFNKAHAERRSLNVYLRDFLSPIEQAKTVRNFHKRKFVDNEDLIQGRLS